MKPTNLEVYKHLLSFPPSYDKNVTLRYYLRLLTCEWSLPTGESLYLNNDTTWKATRIFFSKKDLLSWYHTNITPHSAPSNSWEKLVYLVSNKPQCDYTKTLNITPYITPHPILSELSITPTILLKAAYTDTNYTLPKTCKIVSQPYNTITCDL